MIGGRRGLDGPFLATLSLALVAVAATLVAPAFGPPPGGPAAGSPGVTGRAYVEGVLGGATNVSPFGARSPAERMLVAVVFRGLVRLGPGESLVPDLAERWTVDPSGAVWTFRLRADASWQDGTPVTAADVVFTIGALSDPDYTGQGAGSWNDVRAVALDPQTVRLELGVPLGGFLQAATQPIAPAHLLGAVPPGELSEHAFGRHPIGSGPFTLESLDVGHAVLAVAIPPPAADDVSPAPTALATGLPLPYLAGLELRFFDDAAELEAAWRAGDLDAVSGLLPADLVELAAGGAADLVRYPGSTLLAVVPNIRASKPALRDPAVRLALLGAIDRDAIVAETLAGLAIRADSAIPPRSWAFDRAASPIVPFDASAAIAALEVAGWTQGDGGWTPKGAKEPLLLEILGPREDSSPAAYDVAEAVAGAWRSIGLRVTHATPEPSVLADRMRAGEFDAAVIGISIGLDPDLYPLLASTQTTGARTNVLGLQDAALDALLAAARAPGTDEARKAAYSALQVALAAKTYLLPLAFRDEAALVSDRLSGYAVRPVGDPGGRFWDVLTWRLADGR